MCVHRRQIRKSLPAERGKPFRIHIPEIPTVFTLASFMLGITSHCFSSPRIYELASAFLGVGEWALCDRQVWVPWCLEKEQAHGMAICIPGLWESYSLTSRKKVIFCPTCIWVLTLGTKREGPWVAHTPFLQLFQMLRFLPHYFHSSRLCVWFTSDKNIECSGETNEKHIPGALKCCFYRRRSWNPPSDFSKGKRKQYAFFRPLILLHNIRNWNRPAYILKWQFTVVSLAPASPTRSGVERCHYVHNYLFILYEIVFVLDPSIEGWLKYIIWVCSLSAIADSRLFLVFLFFKNLHHLWPLFLLSSGIHHNRFDISL